MPPGAVTLDDVDLDQVSVDYVLNCAKKSEFNLVRCVVFHPFCFDFLVSIIYYSIIQVKCLSFQKLLEIIMITLDYPKWYVILDI
jgi:presenilin-like A22 family membrane protease